MTAQDIIQQTKSFTKQEKQQLAYYFLFSTIDEEDRKQFASLFHYKNENENVDEISNPTQKTDFTKLSWFNCLNDIENTGLQLQKQSLNYR